LVFELAGCNTPHPALLRGWGVRLREPIARRSGDPIQRISRSPSPARRLCARRGREGCPAHRGPCETGRRASAYLGDARTARPPFRRKASVHALRCTCAFRSTEHRPAVTGVRWALRSGRGNDGQDDLQMVRYQ